MNLTLKQYRLWQMEQPMGPWFYTDNSAPGGLPAYDADKGDFVSKATADAIKVYFDAQLGVKSTLRKDPRTKSYDGNDRWLLDYTDGEQRECSTAIGDVRGEMCDPFAWMFEKYEDTYWVGIDVETAMPAVNAQGETRGMFAWCAPRSTGLSFEYFPDRRKIGEKPPTR